MIYLIEFHWGWLLASALLGLAVGWMAVVHRGPSLSMPGLGWSAGAFVVLAGLALAQVVPGRAGYWLDLGVVMFVLYMIGCSIGASLRERVI